MAWTLVWIKLCFGGFTGFFFSLFCFRGLVHVWEEECVWHVSFLSLMKASQTVSLFSVGFPLANYRAPPSSILHPSVSMITQRVHNLLSASSHSALKSIAIRGPTSSVLPPPVKWISSVRFICQCSLWSASPPVNRTDSSVHLTQDQWAIMVLSPEGWSHCPQTATQEGEHMAVVMRLYTRPIGRNRL